MLQQTEWTNGTLDRATFAVDNGPQPKLPRGRICAWEIVWKEQLVQGMTATQNRRRSVLSLPLFRVRGFSDHIDVVSPVTNIKCCNHLRCRSQWFNRLLPEIG